MSRHAAAPPYLDEASIERLADLLDRRAVPFKGFNLEALDGYLSALVVSPGLVMPSEWQPRIWGGKEPRWQDADEAREVLTLLMAHWNMCAARVRHDEDDLPDHLAPLMWLPEDPELTGEDALHEDELDVGSDWALGFFEGVSLREAEWDAWLDGNDWMDEAFDMLDRLATGEVLDPHGMPADPCTPEELLQKFARLAARMRTPEACCPFLGARGLVRWDERAARPSCHATACVKA